MHDFVPVELEAEPAVINWNAELVEDLGSQLYPLWNRTAGDCLLDSVMQATWGVVDRDNTLRMALADSLVDGATRCMYYLLYRVSPTHHSPSLPPSQPSHQPTIPLHSHPPTTPLYSHQPLLPLLTQVLCTMERSRTATISDPRLQPRRRTATTRLGCNCGPRRPEGEIP